MRRSFTYAKISNVEFHLGGPEALRGVAKIGYNFACSYAARSNARCDFAEIESFVFEGRQSGELCLFDSRDAIYEPAADLSNTVAVHFNATKRNIVASMTLLGSIGHSALLSRSYDGKKSFTIRMRNSPLDPRTRDVFEKTSLERDVDTDWLLDRSYWCSPGEGAVVGPSKIEALIGRVVSFHQRKAAEERFAQIIREEIGPDDTVWTDELGARIAARIARELARRMPRR